MTLILASSTQGITDPFPLLVRGNNGEEKKKRKKQANFLTNWGCHHGLTQEESPLK